jgi:predicted transglutaminase-like cysteine proteinase
MSPEKAVEHVNSFWEYKPDGKIDRWTFKSPGDCENYSLLVLKHIAGGERAAKKWLLSGKAKMWFVQTNNGEPHAVLEYKGKFVDNRFKKWVDSLDDLALKKKGRKRYSKIQLLAKLGFGALFG